MMTDKEKKCFIITPIGNENSEIRRHIDGIIDAAIKPVIEDEYGYKTDVAHRIDAPGNISKQVILEVYNCDLAIANLTGNNPNVMYELALRHCFGKPTIIIADSTTKLPADIIGERSIFYINDAQGVIDLRKKLSSMVNEIEIDLKKERIGPVYDALDDQLEKSAIINTIEAKSEQGDVDTLKYIMNKLDEIDTDLKRIETNRGKYTISLDNNTIKKLSENGAQETIYEYFNKRKGMLNNDKKFSDYIFIDDNK